MILDRVTSIYTIPDRDLLITVSENNVKVWDLEYDECIKNLNEHTSPIIYMGQPESQANPEHVVSVGQGFEYRRWNYVTGAVIEAREFRLGKDKKAMKSLSIAACDIQEETELAYLALCNNEISVYSLKESRVLFTFLSYKGTK